MSNALSRLFDLIPKSPEFVGTITVADHPNYKVLVVDGTGLVSCTSSSEFDVGNRVFVQGQTIVRSAPNGTVINIEV